MSRPARPARDSRTSRAARTEEREVRTVVNSAMVVGASELTGAIDELPDGDSGENTALLETSGDISFTDEDFRDRYTVSIVPQAESGYLGTFTAEAPTTASRSSGIEGTVGWNFSVNDADLDFLGEGETVIQSYDVTIDDNNGHTSTVTVTVTLTGTNEAPVITGGNTTGQVSEDDVLMASGSLTASDDGTGTLSWSVQGGGTGMYGSLAIDSNGNWVYTLDNDSSVVQELNDGETVTDSFTVQVFDGTAFTTEIVSVDVAGASDSGSIGGNLVLDFDDLPSSGNLNSYEGFNFSGNSLYPRDFYWNNKPGIEIASSFGDGTAQTVITRADGSDFDFISGQFADTYQESHPAINESNNIELVGFNNGVELYSETISLSDGAFETVEANFTGIDELRIQGIGPFGAEPYISFDDLAFNVFSTL